MKLVYVTENINAVFYSQVAELLNNIAEESHFKKIYLCIGVRDKESVETIINLNPKIELMSFKTYPMYPVLNSFIENELFNLFKSLGIDDNYIIHTRIEFLGALAYRSYFKLNSKKPNLFIDIRGSVIEEVKLYGKMKPLLKLFKLLGYKRKIQKVLNNTRYINTVSNELKVYIQKNYTIDPNCISVIPTIAGKNFYYSKGIREKLRISIGIEKNEILFVFSSGSSQAWQKEDELVDNLTGKGYKILMLTKKKYDNPNVISRFVPYSEVSSYLCAADIGIIIRNDDIVNNIASPIKFSEYLACGLPIISNRSVEMINTLIENTAFGSVITLSGLNQQIIDNLLQLDRENISKVGIENFGIQQVTDSYLSIYKKIEKDLK